MTSSQLATSGRTGTDVHTDLPSAETQYVFDIYLCD